MMLKKAMKITDIDFAPVLAPVARHDEGAPQINGPSVYGASPCRDFLYLVPATGESPMHFCADGLPDWLVIDADSGIISGKTGREGRYKVRITATNRLGAAEKTLEIVVERGALALTPPMGWNSWNCFRSDIKDGQIRGIAEAMVRSGLAAHGYSYVNLDSGWQGMRRGGTFNSIIPSEAFPDMAGLCRHIHALGLKAGIYSSPYVKPWGTEGRGSSDGTFDSSFPRCHDRFVGMDRHEMEDVRQWAAWGFDYLKYDWAQTDMILADAMRQALDRVDRDIIYSLVVNVKLQDAAQASRISNLYRSNGDTSPSWNSILANGFGNEEWNPFIGPGHWFDLDMMATTPRDGASLSRNERLFHVSCWMMRPSPILLDFDPMEMDDFKVRLFCNDEIIAINQDPLGKPSASIFRNDMWNVWVKPLADGNCAVAFFNLSDKNAVAPWLDLALFAGEHFRMRDLWAREDIDGEGGDCLVGVAPHCARVFKLFRRG